MTKYFRRIKFNYVVWIEHEMLGYIEFSIRYLAFNPFEQIAASLPNAAKGIRQSHKQFSLNTAPALCKKA